MADETLRKDEAHGDDRRRRQAHEAHIAHASGTVDNPMSDAPIEDKFLANATPVIGAERARRAAMDRGAGEAADVRELIALLA